MIGLGKFVANVLVIAAVLATCLADEKHWPDFSCHPFNDTYIHHNAVNHHRMGWYSCKEHHELEKGPCDKICVLWSREILIRRKKNAPFEFDINEFINIFSEELGIDMENIKESEQKLLNRVRSELEGCVKKHPEYATVPVKKTPCEPYQNLFQCIDTAVKC